MPKNINNAVFIKRRRKGVSKSYKLSPLRNSTTDRFQANSPLSVTKNFIDNYRKPAMAKSRIDQ